MKMSLSLRKKLLMLSAVIGISGYILMSMYIPWQAVLGVFLVHWGVNLDSKISKMND